MNENMEITPYMKTKAALRSESTLQRFAEILGKSNAGAYIQSVLIVVGNSPQLQECSYESIIKAALNAATIRLSVDPAVGHAYIVPFKGKATFVIGYKGYQQLALRTGKYRYLNVATIYDGQTVEEDQLKGIHSIVGSRKLGAEPIGYLLYFELTSGYAKTYYMSVEEIREHAQQYSKSYSNRSSAWQTNFADMCKKTVIRLGLSKYGYFDKDVAMIAAAADDAVEDDDDSVLEGEIIANTELMKAEASKPSSRAEINKNLGFEADSSDTGTDDTSAAQTQNLPGNFSSGNDSSTSVLTPEQRETVERLMTSLQAAGAREYIASDSQRKLLIHMIDDVIFNNSNAHHMIFKVLFGAASLKDITGGQVKALIDYLKPAKDSSGEYTTEKGKAMHALMRYAEQADGQLALFAETPAF